MWAEQILLNVLVFLRAPYFAVDPLGDVRNSQSNELIFMEKSLTDNF